MSETTTAAAPTQVKTAEPLSGSLVDPKAAPVKTEATREITVNGKKMAVTDSQLIALAQKGAFADGKLKSMDVLSGRTKALIDALKTPQGLISILKDPALGANPREVIKSLISSDLIDEDMAGDLEKWVYDKRVRPSRLTPEQLQQEKDLEDYKRLKADKESRDKQELTAKQTAQVDQIRQAVRFEIGKQLQAKKNFPATERSVRDVAEKLRVMNKKGSPVTVESIGKAIDLVHKELLGHQQTMLDAIKDEDPEALINLIGEERALRISRALVNRLKLRDRAKTTPEAKTQPRNGKKLDTELEEKFGMRHGYALKKF